MRKIATATAAIVAAAIGCFPVLVVSSVPAHAEPVSVATVAKAIILDEARKCENGVGVEGGCVGPNGEILKAANNLVIGPIGDIASGTLGESDASVIHQIFGGPIKIF